MEKPRAGLSVAVSSGLLYVFGGRTTSEEYSPPVTLTGVDMYDPKKKKWKHVTDLCFSRCDFGIGIIQTYDDTLVRLYVGQLCMDIPRQTTCKQPPERPGPEDNPAFASCEVCRQASTSFPESLFLFSGSEATQPLTGKLNNGCKKSNINEIQLEVVILKQEV